MVAGHVTLFPPTSTGMRCAPPALKPYSHTWSTAKGCFTVHLAHGLAGFVQSGDVRHAPERRTRGGQVAVIDMKERHAIVAHGRIAQQQIQQQVGFGLCCHPARRLTPVAECTQIVIDERLAADSELGTIGVQRIGFRRFGPAGMGDRTGLAHLLQCANIGQL